MKVCVYVCVCVCVRERERGIRYIQKVPAIFKKNVFWNQYLLSSFQMNWMLEIFTYLIYQLSQLGLLDTVTVPQQKSMISSTRPPVSHGWWPIMLEYKILMAALSVTLTLTHTPFWLLLGSMASWKGTIHSIVGLY